MAMIVPERISDLIEKGSLAGFKKCREISSYQRHVLLSFEKYDVSEVYGTQWAIDMGLAIKIFFIGMKYRLYIWRIQTWIISKKHQLQTVIDDQKGAPRICRQDHHLEPKGSRWSFPGYIRQTRSGCAHQYHFSQQPVLIIGSKNFSLKRTRQGAIFKERYKLAYTIIYQYIRCLNTYFLISTSLIFFRILAILRLKSSMSKPPD